MSSFFLVIRREIRDRPGMIRRALPQDDNCTTGVVQSHPCTERKGGAAIIFVNYAALRP
jgi:hypothetical protein